MPVKSRTPRLILGGLTAFVVTVVGLAPFLESQSRSIWSGDRFWSIGTIGAGVLAVVAVGTAAGLARTRIRTAALVTLGGLLLELPGLYHQAFEALSPVGAGVALGAVTVTIPRMVRAATVAGVLVAVFVSDTLLDPTAVPRRYADYLAQDTAQFQPPIVAATLTALGLTTLTTLIWWRSNADRHRDEPPERMAVRPVVISAVLTLMGVALNWWITINTVWAAIPLVACALLVTVVAARVLENGGQILLMATAAAAMLATSVANSLSSSVSTEVSAPLPTAIFLTVLIIAAATLAAFRPSLVIGYALLVALSVAGIVSYVATTTFSLDSAMSVSDILIRVCGAGAAYTIVSAMQSEPARTGASRLLVGLGVIFGPTAFALLVYPQFSYGWTDYTPITGDTAASRFEPSGDVLILNGAALAIVVICAYASHRLRLISQSGPSTPSVETL
ncbi:hypothetical protein ACFRFQ_02750 [Rhodococcus sp. NPDC056743]|uniref:hypothetical protein n=1 Tax=Rhodococcus sp. NPDC056743 TaxID=3345934 RepID=UPI00366A9E29